MTQLIIAGVETVLPQSFSVTVKRENSFFTKSGEYTYDCTLRLDNPVNQQLYGFLHRLNRAADGSPVGTRRTAILMADGRVYCRGTEVVTKWTDQTVSIQIVSGESELNYFVGQEQKIEDLNLGSVGTIEDEWLDNRTPVYMNADYCLPTIRNTNGQYLNMWTTGQESENENDENYHTYIRVRNIMPQPYLCSLVERILKALGYNLANNYSPVNHLRNTPFNKLFLVNTSSNTEYAKMLPGWTVKDFLTEVEKLCGIVFVTDNTDMENLKCDILLKTIFYQDARQIPLKDVIDAYELKVDSEDSRETEFTASDVSYEIPEHRWANLMKLPEGILESAETLEFDNFSELLSSATQHDYNETTILLDTSTGRRYINCMRYPAHVIDSEDLRAKYLFEVDSFCDLDRENNSSTLQLKITPAPMAMLRPGKIEIIDLGAEDGFMMPVASGGDSSDESEEKTFEEAIRDYKEEQSETVDLYCAFCSNTAPLGTMMGSVVEPVAYTDSYHIQMQSLMFFPTRYYPAFHGEISVPTASLRLADLDADYYQGGYQIDTAHAVTFQTFDPNHIDVRQVYVIGNKRYVVRDVEETITAEGRQPMWRVTCYPIRITDEAIENRWILTRGVWDDGGAWLDDGRWNDGS